MYKMEVDLMVCQELLWRQHCGVEVLEAVVVEEGFSLSLSVEILMIGVKNSSQDCLIS